VFTFDEVDLVLSLNNDYNFSVGRALPIHKDEIDLNKELYLIALQDLAIPFRDNRQTEITEAQHDQQRQLFAQKVVDLLLSTSRWKNNLQINEEHRQILLHYFSDPDSATPPFIKQLYSSNHQHAADLLTMLHQQICHRIPSSCHASAHLDYGLTEGKKIAIPFSGNNKPNKTNSYNNRTEMMNRTFQWYLHAGLPTEEVKSFIQNQKQKLQREILQNREKTEVEKLPVAKHFRKTFGLDLVKFNEKDRNAIRQVQNILLSQDPDASKFLMNYVADEILAKEKLYPEQIQSTAHHLFNMPKVREGYSGTVEDIKSAFEINCIPEVGTNGKIVDYTLTQNNIIHIVDTNRPQETLSVASSSTVAVAPKKDGVSVVTTILNSVLSEEKALKDPTIKRFRALIDTGPLFKGVDSREAAVEILHFMQQYPDRGVKGVFYWDDKTELLCCVKPGRENSPIVLETTDPEAIYATTELGPDDFFVFFPHHKRIGADIPLADDAKALSTVSENTTLRDLAQGDFRMRKLAKEQRIERVISPELIPLIRETIGEQNAPLDIGMLTNFLFLNGMKKQKGNLIRSAFLEMEAAAEKHVDDLMFAADTLEEEQALFAKAQKLFIMNIEVSYFLEYGQDVNEKSLEEYLNEKIAELKATVIGNEESALLSNSEIDFINKLEKIKKRVLKTFPNMVVDKDQIQGSSNKIAEQQQENTQTQQSKAQTEVQSIRQLYEEPPLGHENTPWIKPVCFLSNYGVGTDSDPDTADFDEKELLAPNIWKLNTIEVDIPEQENFIESMQGNLYASENFVRTVSNEVNLFDKKSKAIYEVLAQYNKDASEGENPWTLIILSSYDADCLKEQLNLKTTGTDNFILLEPNLDIVQQGNLKLKAISKEHLQQLHRAMIPVLFLNGDINTLSSKEWLPYFNEWIEIYPEEKLALFENQILKKGTVDPQGYFGSAMQLALYDKAAITATA
jgi:hypothetical protein